MLLFHVSPPQSCCSSCQVLKPSPLGLSIITSMNTAQMVIAPLKVRTAYGPTSSPRCDHIIVPDPIRPEHLRLRQPLHHPVRLLLHLAFE